MESPLSQQPTLESLPLFPLGTVLYPGEEFVASYEDLDGYLDMIGKCHKLGAPFGVVALTRGSEVQRAPNAGPTGDAFPDEGFHDVGTLATIEQLSRPQPGLIEIRCVGTQRFTLRRREKLRHGLWIGVVYTRNGRALLSLPPGEYVLHAGRGMGRLDLYWGKGAEAKQAAGVMKQWGRLCYMGPNAELLTQLEAGSL